MAYPDGNGAGRATGAIPVGDKGRRRRLTARAGAPLRGTAANGIPRPTAALAAYAWSDGRTAAVSRRNPQPQIRGRAARIASRPTSSDTSGGGRDRSAPHGGKAFTHRRAAPHVRASPARAKRPAPRGDDGRRCAFALPSSDRAAQRAGHPGSPSPGADPRQANGSPTSAPASFSIRATPSCPSCSAITYAVSPWVAVVLGSTPASNNTLTTSA